MALEPAKLTDFAVAGSLGTGTTAKVYDAIHRATGRAVAIKLMEQGASENDAESRERFAREALVLAGVDSPHVGKILGYGFERGQPFLVLERLYGETLGAKLRRDGPIAPPMAFKWIEQLLLGVRDCHDANVIHRDIKPSNLFLHQQGFDEVAKLIDFGVARHREIGRLSSRESAADGDLTAPNHVIGSMAYMAPEQLQNPKSVGFQADLYAIGVVVYRTLTGRLPFVSRSAEAVLRMKVEQKAPAISALGGAALQIPLLDTFVWTALRREPESRFRNAREMLDQWRMIMTSLELEEEATDIMGGVGRVDESYAGPRPRPGSSADAEEAAHGWEEIRAAEEDRTLRQFQLPLPSGRGSVVPPRPRPRAASVAPLSSDRTLRDFVPTRSEGAEPPASGATDTTLVGRENASASANASANASAEEEVPTKSHPNLRELVQRELDLYRARDSKG